LIEAVIGLILVAIIGQGVVFIASRTATKNGQIRLQEMATNQMRSLLANNKMDGIDLCTTAPTIVLPNNLSIVAQVQGCDATTTATIDGVEVADVPKPIALSVTATQLGGQVVVGGTWN